MTVCIAIDDENEMIVNVKTWSRCCTVAGTYSDFVIQMETIIIIMKDIHDTIYRAIDGHLSMNLLH